MVDVEIEAWVAGGRGLGRVEGRVWLVPGAVPGDVVRAAIRRDHGRWVDGALVAIASPSAERRDPPCPYQPACGGCPLMPVDEARQRDAKRRMVVDALERIGKLAGVDVATCVPSGSALGYRNKIELSFGPGTVGYHAAHDPSRIVDVAVCAIADPRLQAPLAIVRAALADGSLAPRPGRLVLRASGSGPGVLVGFRDAGEPFPEAPSIAEALRAGVAELVGVVRLVAPPGRRGGTRVETILGQDWIGESFLGVDYRVPAGTFLQVNPGAAESLARHVVEGAGRPSRVLELYGGIGAIGLALAALPAAVTVVDADRDAIACGREAAERAGRSVRLVHADVLRFLREERHRADLVVADPPRTGFGPGVAEALAATAPTRIAIVSCDPATLARDLARLVSGGYDVEGVVPFDLFPQTAHVEAVAWLTRRGGPRRTRPGASPRRASGSH